MVFIKYYKDKEHLRTAIDTISKRNERTHIKDQQMLDNMKLSVHDTYIFTSIDLLAKNIKIARKHTVTLHVSSSSRKYINDRIKGLKPSPIVIKAAREEAECKKLFQDSKLLTSILSL